MSNEPNSPNETRLPYSGPFVVLPAQKTGMAVTSMVLGLLGLVACAPLGLVGIILGGIALARAGRRPAEYGGKGYAITGICTGSVGLLILPLMLAILLPSLSRARELAKRLVDANNFTTIHTAMLSYAQGNPNSPLTNLTSLVQAGALPAKALQSPLDDNLNDVCDYYFVADNPPSAGPNWIQAFGDSADSNGEGANVLYRDGHVAWEREPHFTRLLQDFQQKFQQATGSPPTIIPPS